MSKNKDQNHHTGKFDLEPSELIGQHFGRPEDEEIRIGKHTDETLISADNADKEKRTVSEQQRTGNKRKDKKEIKKEEPVSSTISQGEEEVNQKEALEDLTKRLEQELDGRSFTQPVDMTDEKKEGESEDILELEREIEDLEESLLPKQDLEPRKSLAPLDSRGKPQHELESGQQSKGEKYTDETLIAADNTDKKEEEDADKTDSTRIDADEKEKEKKKRKEEKEKRKQEEKERKLGEKEEKEIKKLEIKKLKEQKKKEGKERKRKEVEERERIKREKEERERQEKEQKEKEKEEKKIKEREEKEKIKKEKEEEKERKRQEKEEKRKQKEEVKLREKEKQERLRKEKEEQKQKEIEERKRKKEEEELRREEEEKRKEIEKLRNKEIKEEERLRKEEEKRKLKEEKEKRQEEERLRGQEEKMRKKEERERYKLEKKHAKEQLKLEKQRQKAMQPKLSFSWYVNVIKRPVIYLAGIEFLIYFFSSLALIKSFLLNIVLPLIIILDIIVFGWLTLKVVRHRNQSHWIAIKTCLLAGVFVGLARAIFKVIWINEMWTVFNIIVEPIVVGGMAGVVSLVIGIFVKKKQDAPLPSPPPSPMTSTQLASQGEAGRSLIDEVGQDTVGTDEEVDKHQISNHKFQIKEKNN